MNMGFSEKQIEYFNNATKRWNVKTGATRSGKTYCDYFVIPKRIRATKNQGLIVILGTTQSTIERNILDPMRNIWGTDLVGNISSNNTIRLFGKKVYVLGADSKKSSSKIQGGGIEYCYGDEITTWAEETFQMLKSRLDKPNSVFDGTCNPDRPTHWFKQFLDSDANIYHQHYTIDDNPFLEPFFVEELKKEYSGMYYQRYILGRWAKAEGLIYDMFDKDVHLIDKPENSYLSYYVSVDYGSQNPTVFLLWGESQTGEWHCIKEYFYSGRANERQKTDVEYANDLDDFLADVKYEPTIVVDPSASSFKAELRQRGRIVRDANNSVLAGLRFTQSCLKKQIVKIVRSCKNTIREFESYSWHESEHEDRPVKEDDHCMDAFRYFCYTIVSRYYRNM